jgi:hypothetical protein
MENNKLIITPKTKVLELIESYPQLEDVLIKYVPAFERLKNPVLRKTIAKVATLHQAASIGNVSVGDLINHLRNEIGQDLIHEQEKEMNNPNQPDWFNKSDIVNVFDVREMLAAGEHPVGQVMADLSEMPDGKIYQLVAPFLPAPLIDKATGIGFTHWVSAEDDNLYNIYFIRE